METELKAVSRLVVSKKRMSVDEICEALGLSRRQVLYRLEKINQILSSHKVPPVVVGHVLVVDPVTREALLAACQGHARLHEYEFTPAQRQLVLYLMLFEGRDRLILQDFMEALDVSRNTVLADLKQLRQSLEAADMVAVPFGAAG
ncbi:HTH domain-containing protein, partial [uncultured Faecalibaculum sp.]|uniref:HTH domain-containing protein n=1 Tax=uncultured Faecalibaculum sp. TaxID=1729681 RepID=UPI002711DBAE